MTDTLRTPGSIESGAVALEAVSLTGDRKAPPPGRVTWEEFLAWADDSTRAEWVDGEIIVTSPSNVEHLRIIGFLFEILRRFVRDRDLGEVFSTELLMRLELRASGRVPDLLFITKEHAERVRTTHLDGPADLVVEVVSPESDARDHGDKLVEYEAAGIPEYWLIDPLRQQAFFYQLGEDKRYRLGLIDGDGYYRSTVLADFRLRVTWLWQQPQPIEEALLALGL